MSNWTDAEYAWANAHNGCGYWNDCWDECSRHWLEQARRVLVGGRASWLPSTEASS